VALTFQSRAWRRLSLAQQATALLGAGACLLSLGLFLCLPTSAQLPAPASVPGRAQSEVPKDSLGRTTPRGTVLGFLIAASKGDDDLAAQYLNTGYRGKAAAVLAHQLFVVLNRNLPPTLNEISDQPQGSLSNPIPRSEELVGTISGDNAKVEVLLERVDRGSSGSLWLFSTETLDSIPDLYDESNSKPVETVLPAFLVNTRLGGIPLFEWLAILVGLPFFFLVMVWLNRLLSPPLGALRRRLKPGLPNPEFLPNPVRLLLFAVLIRWIISRVNLPLLARQFWSSMSTVITIATCVWLWFLLNKLVEERLQRFSRSRHIFGTTSILRLARRVMDLVAIFVGVLVTLRYFRVNATAELAGLGVGGIAVAFAAQKTLENVVGGISIIFDRAVRVGDTIRLGGIQGTVEDTGIRSTRIRTLDRTVLIVPNGHIADMSLENLSSRDKFWFHQVLALRYGTSTPQMQSVLDDIRGLLKENPHFDSDSVRVRFLRFGPSSLEVEVFAYTSTHDLNEFLEIQETLLLRIMNCIESTGVQMAFPFQTILAPASASDDTTGQTLTTAPTRRSGSSTTNVAPKPTLSKTS
jgi:MscS family membrane protein